METNVKQRLLKAIPSATPLLGPAVLRAMAETPLDLRDKLPSKDFSTALVRYRVND